MTSLYEREVEIMNISTILVCCLGKKHTLTHITCIHAYASSQMYTTLKSIRLLCAITLHPNSHRKVLIKTMNKKLSLTYSNVVEYFLHTYTIISGYNFILHRQYLHNCGKDEPCLHKLLVYLWLLTDGSHVCSCHTMLGDKSTNWTLGWHCYIHTLYGSFHDIHWHWVTWLQYFYWTDYWKLN